MEVLDDGVQCVNRVPSACGRADGRERVWLAGGEKQDDGGGDPRGRAGHNRHVCQATPRAKL